MYVWVCVQFRFYAEIPFRCNRNELIESGIMHGSVVHIFTRWMISTDWRRKKHNRKKRLTKQTAKGNNHSNRSWLNTRRFKQHCCVCVYVRRECLLRFIQFDELARSLATAACLHVCVYVIVNVSESMHERLKRSSLAIVTLYVYYYGSLALSHAHVTGIGV